jgi:hypothetical protein
LLAAGQAVRLRYYTCTLPGDIQRWACILTQGSDVDLGLPPVAADGPKARRRPPDIVEQSEQPRVCFQVDADALQCIVPPEVCVTAALRRGPAQEIRSAKRNAEPAALPLQLEPPLPGDWTQLFADDLFEFALQLPPLVHDASREWHHNSCKSGPRGH